MKSILQSREYQYPAHRKSYSNNNLMAWTKEDESKLMHLMDVEKLSMQKIAGILNRTYCSIKEKRKNLLRHKT